MNIVTALFTRAIALKASQRDGDGDGLINDGTSQEMPSSVYADRLQKLRQRRGEDRNGVSLAVTETPEFKRWFGDSKVVDENGKPLVVYHGTKVEFREFRHDTNSMSPDRGFYFTPDAEYASGYAESFASQAGTKVPHGANVMPVYLKLERPLFVLSKPQGANGFDHSAMRKVIKDGYDGLIVGLTQYEYENGHRKLQDASEIVVFSKRQIKSAAGNNGQFDPRSADISKSLSIGKG